MVAGEALIDLVPAGDGMLAAHPGGGPFNTARSLGRLERPVSYLGRISTDRFGAQLAGELAADGVRLDSHVRTDDPTTLALVELDAHGVGRYRFYTEGTAAPGLTEADALAALPDGVEFLHIGTLGLVLEPMAAALEALAGALSGRALVMVDPNCRPAIISDPAAFRARLARVLALADVVKVSEEDLAWVSPGVPTTGAARALLGRGPRLVLLTLGGEGALAITRRARAGARGAAGRGGRHDRRRRRVLRRLAGVVVRARARSRRAGRRRTHRRGDGVRLPRRSAHVRARGRVTAEAGGAHARGVTMLIPGGG